tara:strand:- start:1232 stop:1408 length:177 start_codon:yes stop_codon:yes gene_type:complete
MVQDVTFTLPEAQLDRFLMHVEVGSPSPAMEYEMRLLARMDARITHSHRNITGTHGGC